MTHQNDNYFYWVTSPVFGNVRLQHHKGIVQAVDDGRLKWSIGHAIDEVIEWVKVKEVAPEVIDYTKRDRERQIMWEVEKRQIMETLRREWEDKTNEDVN